MAERLGTDGDFWRYHCPEGHPGPRVMETTQTAYCQQCNRSYPLTEIVDKKHGRTLPEGFRP